MRIMAYLLYALIVAVVVLFAAGNWDSVTLRLWDDLVLDIRLPLLMLAMLVLGALPGWILGGITRFRSQRRIRQLERELDALRQDKAAENTAVAAIVAPVAPAVDGTPPLPVSQPGA